MKIDGAVNVPDSILREDNEAHLRHCKRKIKSHCNANKKLHTMQNGGSSLLELKLGPIWCQGEKLLFLSDGKEWRKRLGEMRINFYNVKKDSLAPIYWMTGDF